MSCHTWGRATGQWRRLYISGIDTSISDTFPYGCSKDAPRCRKETTMTASDPCRNTMMNGTPLFRRFITTLALFMAAAPVQVHGSNDADIALGRGKRWVRNNPFTTTALTLVPSVFDANDYNSANLNTVLAWKIKTKILEKYVNRSQTKAESYPMK